MRTSSDFQTGVLVLLVATIVFGIFAALLIAPMLQGEDVSQVTSVSTPRAVVPRHYAEFYPTEKKKIASKLDTAAAMAGRSSVQQKAVPLSEVASRSSGVRQQTPTFDRAVAAQTSVRPAQSGYYERRAHLPVRSVAGSNGLTERRLENSDTDLPRSLPGGSVYAPVTVNLDGSLFAGQVQAMEDRIKAAIDTQDSKDSSKRRKTARSERRNATAAGRKQESVQAETLDQITDGLQRVASSLEQLERKTETSLTELSRRTAMKSESSRRQIQELQQILDTKLRAAEVAKRTVIASRPQAAVGDVARPTFSQPLNDDQAGFAVVPEETVEPADPTPLEPNDERPTLEELLEQGESVPFPAQPQEFPQQQPVTENPAAPPMKTEPQPIPAAETTQPEASTPVLLRGENLPPAQSSKASLPSPAVELLDDTFEAPEVQMFDPEVRTFEPGGEQQSEPKSAEPVEEPVETSQAILRSVPEEIPDSGASALGLPSVGFEHVYRFKMADVENGVEVVPADGACPHCGKAHHGNCQHASSERSKVTQTSAIVHRGPTSTKRRSAQNNNKKRVSYIPKLKFPSMTTNDKEPGILHRIGSSLRHVGRRTVE